jgi:hypothetical protein
MISMIQCVRSHSRYVAMRVTSETPRSWDSFGHAWSISRQTACTSYSSRSPAPLSHGRAEAHASAQMKDGDKSVLGDIQVPSFLLCVCVYAYTNEPQRRRILCNQHHSPSSGFPVCIWQTKPCQLSIYMQKNGGKNAQARGHISANRWLAGAGKGKGKGKGRALQGTFTSVFKPPLTETYRPRNITQFSYVFKSLGDICCFGEQQSSRYAGQAAP